MSSPSLQFHDVLAAISFANVQTPPPPRVSTSVLLMIDCQRLVDPDYMLEQAEAAGLDPDATKAAISEYAARYTTAIRNIAAIQNQARKIGMPLIHVKIQSRNVQGRDTNPVHRRMGWCFSPDNPATEFIESTGPKGGETVIVKSASGAFTGTGLDHMLRHMGIDYVYICGFMADECVETTARMALDFGYLTRVISDGTTAYDSQSAQNTISKLSSYGFTLNKEDMIALMGSMPE